MKSGTQSEDSADELILGMQGHPKQNRRDCLDPLAGYLDDFVQKLQSDVRNLFESNARQLRGKHLFE